MANFKEISRNSRNHSAYVADAIQILTSECDWVSADDQNILVFTDKHGDFVAIPDIYCDETTEFTTTKGNMVRLDSGKRGDYVVTVIE